MNTKRWIWASLAVFVISQILEYIIHGIILAGAYQATATLWRSEEEMRSMAWMMWLSGLIFSFLFVYIFAKGYENRGFMEGVRFGVLMGVFFSVPMSLGTYASMPITGAIAVGWFVWGVIEITLLGILTAIIYKPAEAPVAKTAAA